jgi:hypothetical protein
VQPREAVPESGRSHFKQSKSCSRNRHGASATATAALPRGSGAAAAGAAARGPVASDRNHHGARASATHWQAGSARTRADSDASAISVTAPAVAGPAARPPPAGRPGPGPTVRPGRDDHPQLCQGQIMPVITGKSPVTATRQVDSELEGVRAWRRSPSESSVPVTASGSLRLRRPECRGRGRRTPGDWHPPASESDDDLWLTGRLA